MRKIRRSLWAYIGDLFYPPHLQCLLCRKETLLNGDDLCAECAPKVPLAPQYRRLSNAVAASAYVFEGETRELIHRLKYRNERYLAPFFAKGMVKALPKDLAFDIIIPVPLHKKRKRQRGYNQSELLARELSIALNIPLDTRTLRRVRNTVTQTNLDARQREANLRGAFASNPVNTKRVLLVDDVLTTGHTLQFCAQALLQAGAAFVYALTASC